MSKLPESGLPESFTLLPPVPASVRTLVAGVRSGTTNPGEIADLLAPAPQLTGRMLKFVNSRYYGLPSQIRGIKHAAAYLGPGPIEHLAWVVAVMDELAPDRFEAFAHFWTHSFHTALATRLLFRRHAPGVEPEELHTAALLHDTGKLVCRSLYPDRFRQLDEYCRAHRVPMSTAEQRLKLPSHSALGAAFCDLWGLPESVKRACSFHELQHLDRIDEEFGGDPFLRVIGAANALCNLAGEEYSDETTIELHEVTVRALGLEEDEFLLLMAEVYDLRGEALRFVRDL